jgi:hypothetical protein
VAGAAALCVVASLSAAWGCNSAIQPRGNAFRWFYDPDAYGQLGVLGLSNNVHILDEYRCYDLSFLRNKNLRFFFNNNGTGAQPRYIGAIIVRSFAGRPDSDGAYAEYRYRNSTNDTRGSSQWVHREPNDPPARKGEFVSKQGVNVLSGEYSPDDPIQATDWEDLNKKLKLSTSQVRGKLKEWHALVASPKNSGFLIDDDSSMSDAGWQVDPTIKHRPSEPHYFIVRTYLVKFQDSPNPRAEYFFQSGAEKADCVYVKLVASGDFITQLAIKNETGGPDMIVLKMSKRAVCD